MEKKMKKYILSVIVVLTSLAAQAHCPYGFTANDGGDYCLSVEWAKGDKKVKGTYEESTFQSPYLNKSGELPNKWIYSKALIRVWKKGDAHHVPVQFSDFRIFPYMLMADGMSHFASAQFSYDPDGELYVLSGFSLQEMMGCWSLRWTQSADDSLATSQEIQSIIDYSNLDESENKSAAEMCSGGAEMPMPMPMTGEHHH
jgi:hypothetical protein